MQCQCMRRVPRKLWQNVNVWHNLQVVFDYRLYHRGPANSSPDGVSRPVLYLTFARSDSLYRIHHLPNSCAWY